MTDLNSKFSDIHTWIFDLDNTLYPPEVRLFDQIEEKMRHFVSDFLGISLDAADQLRSKYWASHGTTLAGMMEHHNMPPDDFLQEVHDIDFSVLPHETSLAETIAALPGRCIVFTNGTRPYAQQVLKARGLENAFEEIYGIEHAGFTPKPHRGAFERVFSLAKIEPENAAMFEDDVRNLEVPKAMGMRTVWVHPSQDEYDHVDLQGPGLNDLLEQIATPPSPSSA